MMNKILYSLLPILLPSSHKLKCSFYIMLYTWDSEYLRELELEHRSKLLGAERATIKKKEILYREMANDCNKILLDDHNRELIKIIYNNYGAFKYGYAKSGIHRERYTRIIEKMDYLISNKFSRQDILRECSQYMYNLIPTPKE